MSQPTGLWSAMPVVRPLRTPSLRASRKTHTLDATMRATIASTMPKAPDLLSTEAFADFTGIFAAGMFDATVAVGAAGGGGTAATDGADGAGAGVGGFAGADGAGTAAIGGVVVTGAD